MKSSVSTPICSRVATSGKPLSDIPEIRKDIRDLTKTDLDGFDAVVHLGALSNDPLGNLDAESDLRHQPLGFGPAGRTGEGSRGKALCLLLILQHLWRGGEMIPRRNRATEPGHAVWGIEGLGRARRRATGRRPFQPNLYAECDCLWRFSAPAAGHRFERLGGVGIHHGPSVHKERRHALAAHRAYSRHHCGDSRCAGSAEEAIHNETFNVGQTEENYRISELADIVAETVPGCHVEYAPDGGPDKRCYRVNCDKIRRVLPSFRPQWTARKGAQELYDAYRAAGLTRKI